MGEQVYRTLPDIRSDRYVWGRQLIMNESDEITGEVEKLLTTACGLGIYEAAGLCRELGGLPVPAHIDKSSYSAISVLGVLPEDLGFSIVEAARPHKLLPMQTAGLLPEGP